MTASKPIREFTGIKWLTSRLVTKAKATQRAHNALKESNTDPTKEGSLTLNIDKVSDFINIVMFTLRDIELVIKNLDDQNLSDKQIVLSELLYSKVDTLMMGHGFIGDMTDINKKFHVEYLQGFIGILHISFMSIDDTAKALVESLNDAPDTADKMALQFANLSETKH